MNITIKGRRVFAMKTTAGVIKAGRFSLFDHRNRVITPASFPTVFGLAFAPCFPRNSPEYDPTCSLYSHGTSIGHFPDFATE